MSSTTARDLHRMLQQVTPHMSTDNTLPAIAAIKLEARAGHLYASTTDRYTMAVARTPIVDEGDWHAPIPADDVPAATAWLKAASTTTINVTASEDGDLTVLALTGNGGTLRVASNTRTYRSGTHWRTVLRKELSANLETAPLTGFTTEYLARWQHAGKTLSGWQAGPGKALILMDDAGEFIGMQVPINNRHLDRDDMKAKWANALTRIAYVDSQSYSLDVQWSDAQGDPWEYTGRDRQGEPLMRVVDIDGDDHTLADLLALYGPINPIPAA